MATGLDAPAPSHSLSSYRNIAESVAILEDAVSVWGNAHQYLLDSQATGSGSAIDREQMRRARRTEASGLELPEQVHVTLRDEYNFQDSWFINYSTAGGFVSCLHVMDLIQKLEAFMTNQWSITFTLNGKKARCLLIGSSPQTYSALEKKLKAARDQLRERQSKPRKARRSGSSRRDAIPDIALFHCGLHITIVFPTGSHAAIKVPLTRFSKNDRKLLRLIFDKKAAEVTCLPGSRSLSLEEIRAARKNVPPLHYIELWQAMERDVVGGAVERTRRGHQRADQSQGTDQENYVDFGQQKDGPSGTLERRNTNYLRGVINHFNDTFREILDDGNCAILLGLRDHRGVVVYESEEVVREKGAYRVQVPVFSVGQKDSEH